MTLRVKVYVGQETESLTLQTEAFGHVVQVIVEDDDGNILSTFAQTDNEGSGFSHIDFLNPEDEEDDDGVG